MPPIIGLTTYGYRETHTTSRYYDAHYAVPKEYVDAVTRAGGVPVFIPPDGAAWEALWPALNGIIVTGGTDVEPERYGGDPQNPNVHAEDPARDTAELGLIRYAASAKDKPILCVCRGMQVLNVALGGTLYPHIPDVRQADIHRSAEGLWTQHNCLIERDSTLAKIMRAEVVCTFSGHHQAADRVGEGLEVLARAPDGIIEALAVTDHPWMVGVQWHPEKSAAADPTQQRLFDDLVQKAQDASGS